MISPLDIRNWEEYQEILKIMKKDERIKDYYQRMKEMDPQEEMMSYNRLYSECIEYQRSLIVGLKRSIKIKKILNVNRTTDKDKGFTT